MFIRAFDTQSLCYPPCPKEPLFSMLCSFSDCLELWNTMNFWTDWKPISILLVLVPRIVWMKKLISALSWRMGPLGIRKHPRSRSVHISFIAPDDIFFLFLHKGAVFTLIICLLAHLNPYHTVLKFEKVFYHLLRCLKIVLDEWQTV